MISHEHKCIFIHIPKCAGTSVEKVLGHFEGFVGSSGKQDHRALRTITKPNLSIACLKNKDNILTYLRGVKYHKKQVANPKNHTRVTQKEFDEYFKFSIVRNPWARAFSWYRNVMRDESHRIRHDVTSETTFSDFLNVHAGKWMLRPQTYWLKNYAGEIDLDYIGRFEELPEVLEKIRSRLDLGDVTFPHEISGSGEDYKTHYDSKSIKLIENTYSEDIELFGYSFEN